MAWALTYWMLGFGVTGSALYVDVTQPARFAAAVVERAPILLFGQWFLPADLYSLLSPSAARVLWLVASTLIALLAVLLAPILRRDRVARFFGLGMVLCLLPACGTFPSGRLLLFTSLGGAGLLAQFLAAWIDGPAWLHKPRAWRGLAAGACWVFVLLHLVLAPVALVQTASNVESLGRIAESVAASLPTDAAFADQTAVVVNTPTFFLSAFGPTLQLWHGRSVPRRVLVLASGSRAVRIERPADAILVVRPEGGFLAPPGSPTAGEQSSQPPFDVRYFYEIVDTLYRDERRFRAGDRVELSGLTIEIGAITSDGRPAEVTYRFGKSLDDSSWRWLQWSHGGYIPFMVPGVGDTIELPPAAVRSGPPGR